MEVILKNDYLHNGSLVYLKDTSCHYGPVSSLQPTRKIYISYDACGTTSKQIGNQITYQNSVYYQDHYDQEYYAINLVCKVLRKNRLKINRPFRFLKPPKLKYSKSKISFFLFFCLYFRLGYGSRKQWEVVV